MQQQLIYSVTNPSMTYATMSNYNPAGKPGTMTQNNNTLITTSYTYDPLSFRLTNLVSRLTTADPNNPGAHIINRAYLYSAAGNITKITDKKKGRELSLPNDAFEYNYTYDKLHRFTRETTTNNIFSQMDYAYDAIGNITSRASGGTTLGYTYDPVKKHAVIGISISGGNPYTFIYDQNGNMTDGYDLTDLQNISARTIGYNVDNMPVSVVHARYGTTAIYYDGTSSRVKKVSPSGTTEYIGSHYEIINGDQTKYIFAGNLRVAKISSVEGTYFYHKDHLGSSAAMTNESGSVLETSNYMPFGQMREHTGLTLSNYKYTDQELDPETGLYYYGARYYDATIGRFISPDSIVQDPFDPQTLNRYTYCRNNPIIYTDPSGNFILEVAALMAVVSAVYTGSQTDWNPRAMLQAAAVSFMSSVIFAYVGQGIGTAVGNVIADAQGLTDISRFPQYASNEPFAYLDLYKAANSISPYAKTMGAFAGFASGIAGGAVGGAAAGSAAIGQMSSGGKGWFDGMKNYLNTRSELQYAAGNHAAAFIDQVGIAAIDVFLPQTVSDVPLMMLGNVGKIGQVGMKGLGKISSGLISEKSVLQAAQKWLGMTYKEISPGVYRSTVDSTRQFRMTSSDLAGHRGYQKSHVHFESVNPITGEILESSHVDLWP